MKTALITGASRGIGASCAQLFAEKGYTVLVNYKESRKAAEDLCNSLTAKGLDAHPICFDVADEKSVAEAFEYIRHYYKKLDVLVANAGVSLYKQLQDTTAADYDKVMSVNCRGAFLSAKYAAPLMLSRSEGSMVFASSCWGLAGASCESVYSMSKFAVVGLSLSLHKELSDSGICVNCVCPPIVATSMNSHLTAEQMEQFNAEFGMPVLQPSDVAEAIYKAATNGESGQVVDKF